ncbi:MAG: phage replisome organizer N-terminal domain-containing protein [Thermodesulfobacteriota bacterium]|nr:phage replisome organizer N-terminal domain-containing protein [Thermodesulfobacteriota bacterium]
MDWVKIMCNILDHRKIKMIRKSPEGNTLVLLWLLILAEAGKCCRGGYLMVSDKMPYTAETLSMITDIPLSTVQLGLTIFEKLEMIDQLDRAIFIRNWGKYQSEDKLEARRKKDRIRQQRHRKKKRNKMKLLPETDNVSRDSHIAPSRDVTQENRQDKKRVEKRTTTEQARLLLFETPLVKISDQELQSLEKRHGSERLLQAVDIAAEIWRRNPEEKHNPGGYLNTLCTSLVVPEWYVPFSQRKLMEKESQRKKEVLEAEQAALAVKDEAETTATRKLWATLSDAQREGYLTKVRGSLPTSINPGMDVLLIMAKSLAKKSTQMCHHD